MAQLSEFIANHIVLVSAAVIILTAIVVNEWVILKRGGQRLRPSEAVRLINDSNALVVDVRSAADFKRGHILDAMHVPTNRIDEELGAIRKHGDRPIVVVCGTGGSSVQASTKLRDAGLNPVYPLAGGLMAWENAGLPVTTK